MRACESEYKTNSLLICFWLLVIKEDSYMLEIVLSDLYISKSLFKTAEKGFRACIKIR